MANEYEVRLVLARAAKKTKNADAAECLFVARSVKIRLT